MATAFTSGESKVLATNSTAAAFALTEGFSDITTLRAAGYGIVPLGEFSTQNDANNSTVPSYSGVRLRAFGVGSDNTTFDVRVWAYTPSGGTKGYVTLVGAASATLSTLFGTDGTAIASANRIADTLTFTLASSATSPTGPWSDIYSALVANVGIYSPANNTSAFIVLPELGSATYLIFDFDMTGATSGNVAVELLA